MTIHGKIMHMFQTSNRYVLFNINVLILTFPGSHATWPCHIWNAGCWPGIPLPDHRMAHSICGRGCPWRATTNGCHSAPRGDYSCGSDQLAESVFLVYGLKLLKASRNKCLLDNYIYTYIHIIHIMYCQHISKHPQKQTVQPWFETILGGQKSFHKDPVGVPKDRRHPSRPLLNGHFKVWP